MSVRLMLAIQAGFSFPDSGPIGVFGPTPDIDLSALPRDRVQIVQGFRPDHDHFADLGYTCSPDPLDGYAGVIVCLPRAKPLAHAMIWQAVTRTAGPVIVDGAKSDGIDSLFKSIRGRVPVSEPVNKAHGRLFWFDADPAAFADWEPVLTHLEGGFVTAPGCFSADAPDPASVLLADTLPAAPGKRVVDLGAGWGYLSARLLERADIAHLDLVEADHAALACARMNVTDPRARFHWADARTWSAPEPVDAVVMNPPFHTGRAADPALGRDFIAAAARLLPGHGSLWMVANRHLAYETALTAHFRDWSEAAGNTRFKVLHARRPSRQRR